MSGRVIVDEIEIEVPYGKLAAKSWHEETDECKRVLALHGWMDNAGSFDNLMPKIKHKDGLYIVALDLPGHGKSSQFPVGSAYSDINIMMEVRRCLKELDWTQNNRKDVNGGNIQDNNNQIVPKKKFSIIGHSLGAGLAMFYACLYPEDVEEIILLDFVKSRTTTPENLLQSMADNMDQFLGTVPSMSPFASPRLQGKAGAPMGKNIDKGQVIVSQETAIIATIEAHKQLGTLSREDAKCLLKRSTVAVSSPPNSVIYSRDLRLQSMLNLREHIDINKIMFSRINCHVFSILSKRGIYVNEESFRAHMDEMVEFYKKRAKSFHLEWCESDHYLHMNNPQETADLINKYLESPSTYQVKTVEAS